MLVAKEETTLLCVHNTDYEIQVPAGTVAFPVQYNNIWQKYIKLNDMIGEILVYNPKFEFECIYVGRISDFKVVDDE